MSSHQTLNSDEYVANLLAEDAKQSSIKYSSVGLSALLPRRLGKGAPKPNTRFLQTILRDTDTHNVALKKKEELEARIRLRNVREARTDNLEFEREQRKKRRLVDDVDVRDSGGRPRRRRRSTENDGKRPRRRDMEHNRTSHSCGQHMSDGREERSMRRGGHRRRSHGVTERGERAKSLERSSRHRRRRRSLSEPSESDHYYKTPSRVVKVQDRSDRRPKHGKTYSPTRSPSPRTTKNHYRGSPFSSHQDPPPARRRNSLSFSAQLPESPTKSSSSTTDPLEDFVGPLPLKPRPESPDQPPLVSRGRNAHRLRSLTSTNSATTISSPPSSFSTAAAIDYHFHPHYNSSLDLYQPPKSPSPPPAHSNRKGHNPTTDHDWDQALEALRDRVLWKQRGADRLRDAGFGEDEIRKWQQQQDRRGGSSSGGGGGGGGGRGEATLAARFPTRQEEKDVENVRWKKRGEEREWDVGKVVVSDGSGTGEVQLRPTWVRGKRQGRN